jgi:hypothetical protein
VGAASSTNTPRSHEVTQYSALTPTCERCQPPAEVLSWRQDSKRHPLSAGRPESGGQDSLSGLHHGGGSSGRPRVPRAWTAVLLAGLAAGRPGMVKRRQTAAGGGTTPRVPSAPGSYASPSPCASAGVPPDGHGPGGDHMGEGSVPAGNPADPETRRMIPGPVSDTCISGPGPAPRPHRLAIRCPLAPGLSPLTRRCMPAGLHRSPAFRPAPDPYETDAPPLREVDLRRGIPCPWIRPRRRR